MLHPDVRVFAVVTGGRIPGLSQYRAVIDAVRILRQKKRLDDRAIAAYLAPYSRKGHRDNVADLVGKKAAGWKALRAWEYLLVDRLGT
jgi:hypothetical protein